MKIYSFELIRFWTQMTLLQLYFIILVLNNESIINISILSSLRTC